MKNFTLAALLLAAIGPNAQAQSSIIDSTGGGLFLSRYVASVTPTATPLIPVLEAAEVAVQTREADEILLEISTDLEATLNASMQQELNAQ